MNSLARLGPRSNIQVLSHASVWKELLRELKREEQEADAQNHMRCFESVACTIHLCIAAFCQQQVC